MNEDYYTIFIGSILSQNIAPPAFEAVLFIKVLVFFITNAQEI